jgi:rubredoxin
MESKMLAIERKLSDYPSSRFLIVSCCNLCHSRFRINQDLHPETTFESVQKKMLCPKCGEGHLSVSIVLNRKKSEKSKSAA